MTPPRTLWCSPSFRLNPMSIGPLNRKILVRTKFVLKWSGWRIVQFWRLDFTQNPPNDSSHYIMMFPKFWTQSDIYWSMKLANSGSYEVRSEMGWLVYCTVLGIGFHSKPTRLLLPQYYDVPQVLDSIRYRLVHEIGQLRFVRSSLWNEVVGVLYSSRDWISLKTKQMTPPNILWCSPISGLNPISIGPWNWIIHVPTIFVLKWSGWCFALF